MYTFLERSCFFLENIFYVCVRELYELLCFCWFLPFLGMYSTHFLVSHLSTQLSKQKALFSLLQFSLTLTSTSYFSRSPSLSLLVWHADSACVDLDTLTPARRAMYHYPRPTKPSTKVREMQTVRARNHMIQWMSWCIRGSRLLSLPWGVSLILRAI